MTPGLTGFKGFYRVLWGHVGSIWGFIILGDDGKENGNYYNGFIYRGYIGIYRDNGKEHGNYYNGVI